MEFIDELFTDGGGRQRVREIKSTTVTKLVALGLQRSEASRKAVEFVKRGGGDLIYFIKECFHNTPKRYGFERRLVLTGFRRTKAHELARVTKPIASHFGIWHRLDIATEYALGHYDPMCRPSQAFPYHDDREEELITRPVQTNANFKIINIVQKQRVNNVIQAFSNGSGDLFFHATSWRSSDAITTHGVRHSKGRPCLDFGSLPSFYVTPDIKTALNWAIKTRGLYRNETCVLVFRSPHRDTLNTLRTKVFTRPNREWAKSVKESRKCEHDIHHLDTYDIVYGPMLANPSEVMMDKADAVPHNPPKQQVAIKSDAADGLMTRNLVGCIYLAK